MEKNWIELNVEKGYFHKKHSLSIKSYNKERKSRDLTLGNDLY